MSLINKKIRLRKENNKNNLKQFLEIKNIKKNDLSREEIKIKLLEIKNSLIPNIKNENKILVYFEKISDLIIYQNNNILFHEIKELDFMKLLFSNFEKFNNNINIINHFLKIISNLLFKYNIFENNNDLVKIINLELNEKIIWNYLFLFANLFNYNNINYKYYFDFNFYKKIENFLLNYNFEKKNLHLLLFFGNNSIKLKNKNFEFLYFIIFILKKNNFIFQNYEDVNYFLSIFQFLLKFNFKINYNYNELLNYNFLNYENEEIIEKKIKILKLLIKNNIQINLDVSIKSCFEIFYNIDNFNIKKNILNFFLLILDKEKEIIYNLFLENLEFTDYLLKTNFDFNSESKNINIKNLIINVFIYLFESYYKNNFFERYFQNIYFNEFINESIKYNNNNLNEDIIYIIDILIKFEEENYIFDINNDNYNKVFEFLNQINFIDDYNRMEFNNKDQDLFFESYPYFNKYLNFYYN